MNHVTGMRQELGLRAPEATIVSVYTAFHVLGIMLSSTEKLQGGMGGRAGGQRR